MKRLVPSVVISALLLGGCGGGSNSGGGTKSLTITISGNTFSPTGFSVPAGSTFTVQNKDAVNHSFTTEASESAFTPGTSGGVTIDTGPFQGSMTGNIPANAIVGSTVWFYCNVHKTAAEQGSFTVTASGTTGGGY